MICYSHLQPAQGSTSIALGFFDGVHRGHQNVLHAALQAADQNHLTPGVFTFTLDSQKPKSKQQNQRLLSPEGQLQKLEEMGFACCWRPGFGEFHQLTPIQFVKQILQDTMQAKFVSCGENYHFGANAAGDAGLLVSLCALFDIKAEIVPTCVENGEPVSSTRIRTAIQNGDMESANQMLGYPWQFREKVVLGNQLGRTMNYPTINQIFPKELVLPKLGVYISATEIHGKRFPSITNIGFKPTIGGVTSPLAETHILDYSEDLYGQEITVFLYRYLRGEKKFDSIQHLFNQIAEDSQTGREFFQQNPFLLH
mgnify:FL=1